MAAVRSRLGAEYAFDYARRSPKRTLLPELRTLHRVRLKVCVEDEGIGFDVQSMVDGG